MAVIVPKILLIEILGLGKVPVDPNSNPEHSIGNLRYELPAQTTSPFAFRFAPL